MWDAWQADSDLLKDSSAWPEHRWLFHSDLLSETDASLYIQPAAMRRVALLCKLLWIREVILCMNTWLFASWRRSHFTSHLSGDVPPFSRDSIMRKEWTMLWRNLVWRDAGVAPSQPTEGAPQGFSFTCKSLMEAGLKYPVEFTEGIHSALPFPLLGHWALTSVVNFLFPSLKRKMSLFHHRLVLR